MDIRLLAEKSNSVMPTSVLSSVATGFPNKVGKAAFPLLKTPDLYHLDLIRMTQEMGGMNYTFLAIKEM